MSKEPLYGKHRAMVINNVDPLQIGRIQAMIPDVTGFVPSTWCMPCVPVAGINSGVLSVPMIGSGVWIEFERGDIDYPIWVGGYWGTTAELPVLAHMVPPGVSGITLQTTLKNGIVINDGMGGLIIQTMANAMIAMTPAGIMLSNGQGAVINMTGPTVDVNVGALTVI